MARAATMSERRVAEARKAHSHAEGSKVGGPPKLSTSFPARPPQRGDVTPVGDEHIGPRRRVVALPVDRERGASPRDEVELLVGEVGSSVCGSTTSRPASSAMYALQPKARMPSVYLTGSQVRLSGPGRPSISLNLTTRGGSGTGTDYESQR